MRTAFDLEFVPGESVVRTAREATVAMSSALPLDRIDDLRLLVGEVVTNAVRHREAGTDWIRIRLTYDATRFRVEVSNAGSSVSFERSPGRGALRESGWGMYLLEHLADRWGVSNREGGTCVWFELAA